MRIVSGWMNKSGLLAVSVLALLVLAACQSKPVHHGQGSMNRLALAQLWEPADPDNYEPPFALDLKHLSRLDSIAKDLVTKRVVYVGETHDRFDHHLNQLEIIKRMYKADNKLVIGVEFFQQPYQFALDKYIAGEIDERTFLEQSEYYDRWRIDYRNYQPILRFAQENGIPVVALDITDELRRRISQVGVEGLSPDERSQVPAEIDRSNQDYRELMQAIFHLHPPTPGQNFERFIEVQVVRDEAMAQTAANYLNRHKEARMVVLAGGGHIVYGFGIPSRLHRRIKADQSIVLNDITHEPGPELADYVLLPKPAGLPRTGKLGVYLDTSQKGVIRITGFVPGSNAESAGVKDTDRIVSINNEIMKSMVDIKYILMEKKPGDGVTVKVERKGLFGGLSQSEYKVVLQ